MSVCNVRVGVVTPDQESALEIMIRTHAPASGVGLESGVQEVEYRCTAGKVKDKTYGLCLIVMLRDMGVDVPDAAECALTKLSANCQ